ncbi:hypothetical protein ZIOFF_074267 (mitochondrion) [Zingiber officinale]|uniref:Uncharacterized protein n=1 Tax=Zingiber officinale TaxID=94328 RepID=A0A8J5BUM7_ZINOF|nr:hypothetical protein ZIOFF_074267 [Zingiber officinale]
MNSMQNNAQPAATALMHPGSSENRASIMRQENLEAGLSVISSPLTASQDVLPSGVRHRLATAYEGYEFDLPAFIDFRGIIYRCGILHFHERDLARGMILFSGRSLEPDVTRFYAASAFHYNKFSHVQHSFDWFISSVVTLSHNRKHVPITQGASASAYQLIPSASGEIKDISSFMLEELQEYMKEHHPSDLTTVVSKNLTRKIVKGILMPVIYGKTQKSTADDLKVLFSQYLAWQDHVKLAKISFAFWKHQSAFLGALIGLIRNIGNFVFAKGRPVVYRIPFFTTVQDYMRVEPAKIWIYD